MLFEVIRIGTLIEQNTQIRGASIFSGDTGLVWHMVILKERFSDQLVMKLRATRHKHELETMIEELNFSGNEFTLEKEEIPCFGEEEELINFIADEILVDWQEDNAAFNHNSNHYPEILVFSNEIENLPVVRKITPLLVDGQEIECITVAPLNS